MKRKDSIPTNPWFSPAPWPAIACCKHAPLWGDIQTIDENELSSVVNAPQHPTTAASTFCPHMLAVVNKCGCCVSVRRTRPRSVGKSIRTSAAPPLSIGKLVKGYLGHMQPRSGAHCPLKLFLDTTPVGSRLMLATCQPAPRLLPNASRCRPPHLDSPAVHTPTRPLEPDLKITREESIYHHSKNIRSGAPYAVKDDAAGLIQNVVRSTVAGQPDHQALT